ncbi:hypothetical protein [Krasilnikovia sp. M28-CT-15]|uniref:hypothetical protein n=1 Tax=Krasilnikovia sp. M28-CT-15 TaxID=3373540 RepID=UPI0038762826
MRTWPWWAVLRIAVVVLWLLAAATAWWTAPRQQSYQQARADVAAGRVAEHQWGDRWDGDTRRWFGDPTLLSSGTLGPLFAWRTPDGRWHWTDTDTYGEVRVADADEKTYAGPGAAALAQDLRAADLEGTSGDVAQTPVITWMEVLLAVVFLGVLVAGPAPRRGTRWYWFWVVTFVPYGLGLLFWTTREHPWARSAAVDTAPGAERPRDSGFRGLAVGILSAIVIGLVMLALQQVLGDWWLPDQDPHR